MQHKTNSFNVLSIFNSLNYLTFSTPKSMPKSLSHMIFFWLLWVDTEPQRKFISNAGCDLYEVLITLPEDSWCKTSYLPTYLTMPSIIKSTIGIDLIDEEHNNFLIASFLVTYGSMALISSAYPSKASTTKKLRDNFNKAISKSLTRTLTMNNKIVGKLLPSPTHSIETISDVIKLRSLESLVKTIIELIKPITSTLTCLSSAPAVGKIKSKKYANYEPIDLIYALGVFSSSMMKISKYYYPELHTLSKKTTPIISATAVSVISGMHLISISKVTLKDIIFSLSNGLDGHFLHESKTIIASLKIIDTIYQLTNIFAARIIYHYNKSTETIEHITSFIASLKIIDKIYQLSDIFTAKIIYYYNEAIKTIEAYTTNYFNRPESLIESCDAKLAQYYADKKGKLGNIDGINNKTPLHYIAEHNCAEVLIKLIIAGANIEERDVQGKTPLMIASENGYENIARILLFYGASLKSKDLDGKDALYYAIAFSHFDIAEILLLYYFLQHGQADAVNFLVEHRAIQDIEDNYSKTASACLKEEVINYDNRDLINPFSQHEEMFYGLDLYGIVVFFDKLVF